ncbi:hypothetical protein ScPMuIL_001676 [Solemya velum]
MDRRLDLQLLLAIEEGEIKGIKDLIDHGANINCLVDGWTPLTAACELGKADIVNFLLQFMPGEDGETFDKKKTSSLKVDAQNSNGETALICAARWGHVDICKLLLQAGASVDQASHNVHQTPLLVATDHSRREVVQCLLDYGADVQLTDNVGITPLYSAIKRRDMDLVELLIEAGCDVNLGSQDHAPIFVAARLGLMDIIKVLSRAGCQKDISNKYGVTPMYEATLKGHIDVLQYLIREGCDPNKADMYGVTPLHIAAMMGNVAAVDILVKAGVDLRLRSQHGHTALLTALERGKAEVVEYFLKLGMDILQKPMGSQGLSSISAVFDKGHTETAEILIRGCAKLPLPHYPGVTEMFRRNPDLLKKLFLSGIQTIPAVLIVPKLHPQNVTDQDLSLWLKNFHTQPKSLKILSRIRIRRCLGNRVLHGVERLPIPVVLREYVTLQRSMSHYRGLSDNRGLDAVERLPISVMLQEWVTLQRGLSGNRGLRAVERLPIPVVLQEWVTLQRSVW